MKSKFVLFSLLVGVSSLAFADFDPDYVATPWEDPMKVADNSAQVAGSNASKARPAATRSPRYFDVYASDETAQFLFSRDGEFINVKEGRTSAAFIFNEQRDIVLTGDIVLDATPAYLPGVRLSFGGRAYAAMLGIENADTIGFALGVEAQYEPKVDYLPLTVRGSYYYAPDIFTFGDTDRVFDWQVDVLLPLRHRVTGYVGIRYLQFDTNPEDRRADRRGHVGLRWQI